MRGRGARLSALLASAVAAFGIGCQRRESAPAATTGPPAAERGAHPAAPPAERPRFGFGHAASPAEIAAWDIDVRPDGAGLPPGRGTVAEGAVLYAQQCAVCHGPEGRGARFEPLAGRDPAGFPFGRDPKALAQRTIGNYWPYATTLYDYINRSMPQAVPGSLRPDEVYGLVAYLLFLNGIVKDDAVVDAQSLPRVVMPARDRFVVDDRRDGPDLR